MSHQFYIDKTILDQRHTISVGLHCLILIKTKGKQAKKSHVAKAFMIPGRSYFPPFNIKHELRQNMLFPGCSLEDQHLIISAPVCGQYLNLYSCLAQHSVCQVSNQGIHDDCNVKITTTSSGSRFSLPWSLHRNQTQTTCAFLNPLSRMNTLLMVVN